LLIAGLSGIESYITMSIEIEKNKKDKRFSWSTIFIISLASIILGVYRDGIAALFPFLQADFCLSRAEIGIYISFLYFAASFFSVFTGQLVDQKGSKWGMVSGILFVGILLIFHSIAPNFIMLLLLAILTGIGLSINLPASNKGITEHFSKKWHSTATGIWSAAFPIGGLLAATLLPFLGVIYGWRKAILFPAGFAFISGLILIVFYQDKTRKNQLSSNNDKKLGILSFWKNLHQLMHNVDLVAISVYGTFLGAASGAITSHFTLFLYLDYGLTESIAGLGFATAHLGSILSRPAWGLVCDKYFGGNKRKGFLIMGTIFFIVTIIFGLDILSGFSNRKLR